MAKGRKPKPTAHKILAGNPGKRKLNESEPTPDLVLPPAPASLNDVGRTKWDEISLKLYNQGILTELDLDLLYLYCVSYQDFVEARTNMKAFGGAVVKTDKGNPIQNPYLSVANQCQERMIKLASLFGMSPVDRSKVQRNVKKRVEPKSLAEKFFNAPVVAERKSK